MSAKRTRLDDPTGYNVVIHEGTSEVCDLYTRAGHALNTDQVAKARTLYTQAVAAEPHNAQGYIGLATCAHCAGNFRAAVQFYQQALHHDPHSASAHLGLGGSHYQLQEFETAAEHYRRTIHLREDLADAHWGAATTYEQLGDHAKMCAHAARFLELEPESPAFSPHARRLLARGQAAQRARPFDQFRRAIRAIRRLGASRGE